MPDLADRNVEISDVTENFGPVPKENLVSNLDRKKFRAYYLYLLKT